MQHYSEQRHSGWSNLKLLLRLGRYDRPVGAWLLALPCLWGLACAAPSLWDIVYPAALMVIGAFVMRGAGCTYNDWVDQDIDRRVERTRTRPLAAGLITPTAAWLWIVAQLAAGGGVLLSLPRHLWLWCFVPLLWAGLYPWAKRFFAWPQLILGLAFNWGTVLGWHSFASLSHLTPWMLYAAGIFWTLAYDTLYAFQDIEDDLKVGVRSTAIFFQKRGRTAIACFYAGMLACLVIAIVAQAWPPRATAVALVTLLTLFALVFIQVRSITLNVPTSCQQAFLANVRLGWWVTGVLAARLVI